MSDFDCKRLLEEKYVPVIDSYWFWADQFLMIRNIKNSKFWLLNNFINIGYHREHFPGGIYFENKLYRDKMVEFYDCPYLSMQKIYFSNNNIIQGKRIIEFTIDAINNNNYVLLMVNRKYIKSYGFSNDNNHEILIHGYDKKKAIFHFADNNNIGKYCSQLVCGFDELVSAFSNTFSNMYESDFKDSIFTFKPVDNNQYELNINKIVSDIIAYLDSNLITLDKRNTGIAVYDDLASYFKNVIKGENIRKDIRGISALHDHKKAMYFRIHEIMKICNIPYDIINGYNHICNSSKNLIGLALKYEYINDVKILKKIINNLELIKKKEEEMLSLLVKVLE